MGADTAGHAGGWVARPAVPQRVSLPVPPAPRPASDLPAPAAPRPASELPAPPEPGRAPGGPRAPGAARPEQAPPAAAPRRRRALRASARPTLLGAGRPAALWTLRLAVLVQVGALLLQSATGGAASSAAPVAAMGPLTGPLLWPVLAAGAAQAGAASAIAVGARTTWLPAVFSVLLLFGGLLHGRLASVVEPAYLLLLGAALVAPGLWVALWAWGWHWPERTEGCRASSGANSDAR